jgi:uncharacterized membrane protein YdjX (TVP38/TMEM64 family)
MLAVGCARALHRALRRLPAARRPPHPPPAPPRSPERQRGRAAATAAADAAERGADGHAKPRHAPAAAYLRSLAWIRPALALAFLYAAGLALLGALVARLPPRGGGAPGAPPPPPLRAPHSFDELRAVRAALEEYHGAHAGDVLLLMAALYLFLQAFCIPGPILINVLAGSLLSFPRALLFAAAVSTAGAALNFLLVRALLRGVVAGLFPARVAAFQAEAARHRASGALFSYMLFIRVTPVLPHWFVNLASPIAGVPFGTFALATAIGHLPISAISVRAGAALADVRSLADLYSPRNVALLMAAGVAALFPLWWKRRRAARAAAAAGARPKPLRVLPVIAVGGPARSAGLHTT